MIARLVAVSTPEQQEFTRRVVASGRVNAPVLGRARIPKYVAELGNGGRSSRRHDRIVRTPFAQAMHLPDTGQCEQRNDAENDDVPDDPARANQEAVHGAASVCDIDAA